MIAKIDTLSPAQLAMVQWTARLGAVTAEALAVHDGCSVASARGRLQVGVRARQLTRARPLSGRPALYSVTATGLNAAGLSGLDPCRVSGATAAHAIACAEAAARLERTYADHEVMGERELRRQEREHGAALASATIGVGARDEPLLHRPDLVLWPRTVQCLPLAVEVELTIKAPRRLLEICMAWARCRCVAGVLYIAAPQVRRPLERALAKAQAGERVVVLELERLDPGSAASLGAALARTVPSAP